LTSVSPSALRGQRQAILSPERQASARLRSLTYSSSSHSSSESSASKGSVYRGLRGKGSVLPDPRSAGLAGSQRGRRFFGPDAGETCAHLAGSVPIPGKTRTERLAPKGDPGKHARTDGAGDLRSNIEAMTAQGPLIMVLEDLHWVDNSTLDVISVLARRRVPASCS